MKKEKRKTNGEDQKIKVKRGSQCRTRYTKRGGITKKRHQREGWAKVWIKLFDAKVRKINYLLSLLFRLKIPTVAHLKKILSPIYAISFQSRSLVSLFVQRSENMSARCDAAAKCAETSNCQLKRTYNVHTTSLTLVRRTIGCCSFHNSAP